MDILILERKVGVMKGAFMLSLLRNLYYPLKRYVVLMVILTSLTPSLVAAADDVDFEGELAQQVQSFAEQIRPLSANKDEGNSLYSPLSYYLALVALEPGLKESERDLLDDVIISDNMDRETYFENMALFLKEAKNNDNPIFNTETYLLGRDDLEWNPTYLEAVNELATNPMNVDFQDSSTYKLMNEDIAEFTEGLIDPYYTEERIAEMTENKYMQLVIMNLFYFRSNWRSEFNEEKNTEELFFGRDEETTVPMMHKETQFAYLEGEGFKAIKLPYQNRASLLVVIPTEAANDEDMWSAYQTALDQEEDFESRLINLSLPKWKSSGSLDLTDSLDLFGLETFKKDLGQTNFFTAQESTAISQILQRVEFVLDEEGTQAAAVTEIDIETTAAPIEEEPVELIVDQPFIYGIVYEEIPLFEGIINNIAE